MYSNSDLGRYVVGLQPDDRMPHDWLRMVSRVFGAYRHRPLEESIAAYIDGLVLSVDSFDINADPTAVINITPGQAFVDDQFVGFIEDSKLNISQNGWHFLDSNIKERYWIVLQYEWINMAPPREPHIMLIYHNFDDPTDVNNGFNPEQMVILGYVVRVIEQGVESIEVVNTKRPWYEVLFWEMVGDTEVDPIDDLPYMVKINEPESENECVDYAGVPRVGTMDIGWALDFHRVLGDCQDYDVRLHLSQEPGDTNLYINNKKIIYQTIGAVGCFNIEAFSPNGDVNGAKLCVNYDENSSSWWNYSDGLNPDNSQINNLTLTNTPDLATLNGFPLLTQANTFQSGESIYFIGFRDTPPTTRSEPQPDGTVLTSPLEDGDIYYDTRIHAYAFYKKEGATGSWVTFGQSTIVTKEVTIPQPNEVNSVAVDHDPDRPLMVWVGGVLLSNSEYQSAANGTRIDFPSMMLQPNETVKVMAFIDSPSDLLTSFRRVDPAGTIIEHASESPSGYLECDGATYNIDEYPELYQVIGTTYGDNGPDTFKVPLVVPSPFKKFIKY